MASFIPPHFVSPKPQTPRHSASDWEAQKINIKRLYITEERPLREVILILEQDFAFVVSEKQLKSRLPKWGFDKNLKQETKIELARIKAKRAAFENKKTSFRINKKPICDRKVDRYLQENDITEEQLLSMASPVNAPSPAFSVFTPQSLRSPTPGVDDEGRKSRSSTPGLAFQNLSLVDPYPHHQPDLLPTISEEVPMLDLETLQPLFQGLETEPEHGLSFQDAASPTESTSAAGQIPLIAQLSTEAEGVNLASTVSAPDLIAIEEVIMVDDYACESISSLIVEANTENGDFVDDDSDISLPWAAAFAWSVSVEAQYLVTPSEFLHYQSAIETSPKDDLLKSPASAPPSPATGARIEEMSWRIFDAEKGFQSPDGAVERWLEGMWLPELWLKKVESPPISPSESTNPGVTVGVQQSTSQPQTETNTQRGSLVDRKYYGRPHLDLGSGIWGCEFCHRGAGMSYLFDHCPDCGHGRCETCYTQSPSLRRYDLPDRPTRRMYE